MNKILSKLLEKIININKNIFKKALLMDED